jgi:hypothetical protein
MPHVIVLLPGVMGSVLKRNGKEVWAASSSALWNGLVSSFHSIEDLALDHDSQDDDLGDGVTADRLMPDVHLIPGFWKIDGYGKVRDTILATFDVTEGQNYIEFPYDWRRDNRVSARRLQRMAHDWLTNWRQTSGRADAKLVLIAHSMGGIVARYFLDVLEGWRDTKALITFGTPYRGAVNAIDALANGTRKGPFGLLDLSDVVRSFTSPYQLLPIYPCYDPGDGRLLRVGETDGIPNVDAARAADALAFHHEITDRVEANRQDEEYRERGYAIFPIVDIEQPTRQTARREGDGVAFLESYEGNDLRGDGTVPRVSATPLEQSQSPRDMYAGTRHASLQNADAVLTHLTGVLTSVDLDLGSFRAVRAKRNRKALLSLAIEDAYAATEPIPVRVQPDEPGLKLTARVTPATSGRAIARAALHSDPDGWDRAELPPLKSGVYRVTVTGGSRVEPASDIFVVFDGAAS